MYVLPPTFGSAMTRTSVNAFIDEIDLLIDGRFEEILESDSGRFFFSGETETVLLDEARRSIYVQTMTFRRSFASAAQRLSNKLWMYSPRAGEALRTYVRREEAASAMAYDDAVALGGPQGPRDPIVDRAGDTIEALAAESDPFALLGAVYAFGTLRPRMAAVFLEAEARRGREGVGTAYARSLAETEIEQTVQVGKILRLILDENPGAEEATMRGAERTMEIWPLPFLDHGRIAARSRG